MLTRQALLNMILNEAHADPRERIGCIDRASPDELKEVRRIYDEGERRDKKARLAREHAIELQKLKEGIEEVSEELQKENQ